MDEVRRETLRQLRRAAAVCGWAALIGAAGACSHAISQESRDSRSSARAAVERALGDLSRNLRGGDLSRAEGQFSRDFVGGYEDLRDKLRDSQRAERVTDIQFIINRVLESGDKLSLNVQVNWNKAFLDATGRPGRRSGTSEIEFQHAGDALRIISIRGGQFF